MTDFISQVLEVSTGHVTHPQDHTLLMARGWPCIANAGDGWFVKVPDWLDDHQIDELRKDGYSFAFANLLVFAKEQSCLYIRLNQDAAKHPALPFFEW